MRSTAGRNLDSELVETFIAMIDNAEGPREHPRAAKRRTSRRSSPSGGAPREIPTAGLSPYPRRERGRHTGECDALDGAASGARRIH